MSERILFENRWLKIVERSALKRQEVISYTVLERSDSVTLVPISESGRTLLLRQHKVPVNKNLWGFPEGFINPDEKPRDAVVREMLEETGITLSDLHQIGVYHPMPGLTTQTTTVFSAIVRDVDLDELVLPHGEDDILGFHICSLDDVRGMIASGDILSSFSISAFAFWTLSLSSPTA